MTTSRWDILRRSITTMRKNSQTDDPEMAIAFSLVLDEMETIELAHPQVIEVAYCRPVPKADPSSPETRLLRAILGRCPDHDTCTPADHVEDVVPVSDGTVREWARSIGRETGERGRVSNALRAEYASDGAKTTHRHQDGTRWAGPNCESGETPAETDAS